MIPGRPPVDELSLLAGTLDAVGDGSVLLPARTSLAAVALAEEEETVGCTSSDDAVAAPVEATLPLSVEVDDDPVGVTDSETETRRPVDPTKVADGALLPSYEAVGLTDSEATPPVDAVAAVSSVALEDAVGLTDSVVAPPVEATKSAEVEAAVSSLEAVGDTDSDTAPPVEATEEEAAGLAVLSLEAVGFTDSETMPPVEATEASDEAVLAAVGWTSSEEATVAPVDATEVEGACSEDGELAVGDTLSVTEDPVGAASVPVGDVEESDEVVSVASLDVDVLAAVGETIYAGTPPVEPASGEGVEEEEATRLEKKLPRKSVESVLLVVVVAGGEVLSVTVMVVEGAEVAVSSTDDDEVEEEAVTAEPSIPLSMRDSTKELLDADCDSERELSGLDEYVDVVPLAYCLLTGLGK